MAGKRVRYDRCIFKDADGKACKAKRLRDCPWAFCGRHETLKLVEMRAKMRDEEAERQRIPLAAKIFTVMMPYSEQGGAQALANAAFAAADEFFAVVKARSVG